jgi:hypothetical protein
MGTDAEQLFRNVGQREHFIAYCSNPLCASNHRSLEKDGQPTVTYRSAVRHPISELDDINFCAFCGELLTKKCAKCERLLDSTGQRFCVRCGAKVRERPTEADWVQIRKMLAKPEPKPEAGEDIPF